MQAVELIVVPYDVERTNTPMAQGPGELLRRGFDTALGEMGIDVIIRELWSSVKEDKASIVASVARDVARAVARASSRGRFPLVLSAGCLTAVGVAHALQRTARDFGVVWIDAHGDFNTAETTPTGYWDGMALGALCGRSLTEIYKAVELSPVPFRRIVHLGGRALDSTEVEDFQRLNVLLIPPQDVGEKSAGLLSERLGHVKDFYLHVDLDGLDPEVAPAVNFPEKDGIQVDDLLACLGGLATPAAMTLSGMNFNDATEEEAETLMATLIQLVRAVLLKDPEP